MMKLDELTDLTVNEQKDELENLDRKKLEELRKAEDRQTAVDNIDKELSRRTEDDEPKEEGDTPTNDEKTSLEAESDDRISELEAKVDYLIEKCKTTSHEEYENYEA